MKLLLTAATEAEISPLLAYLQKLWLSGSPYKFTREAAEIDICISGVGMMSTAYNLAKACPHSSYDFALQVGVAGSFNESIALGELVHIQTDQYGDLGAEDHYNFIDIFHLGLLDKNAPPFTNGVLSCPAHPMHEKLPALKGKGLTVNTVSGGEFTIQARKHHFACDVESMEGVAFHYVCLKENIPFAQVRSISNYVTPRDKDNWKMKEAIINLNEWLITFIETI